MSSKSAITPAQTPRKVVLVIFTGAKLLDITGPIQVFTDARLENGAPAYRIEIASEAGGLVTTDSGVVLQSVRLEDVFVDPVDTLLIAGGDLAAPPDASDALRACLARNLKRPRRIGSVCLGAFMLARLGVLDGREATTHWAVCERLQREHPSVVVKPDAIFVVSDGIWTSAGVSAGIDMALAMVEADLGHEAALKLARLLVLYLKRHGGQSQFSFELRRQIRDVQGRFDELHLWINDNLGTDLSVSVLAAVAHMSPRNFARVYQRETGKSPARAVEQIRLEAARRLLEEAPDSIKQIAHHTGFGDDERMRRVFVKTLGVSPQDYRSRFGRSARLKTVSIS
ncbi:helix-turn-helix domain-containing protein [Burkholderia sp. Bp9143]|uniref:GlxA family transcriptional regulator n=1 Tax=Burkholderia sp. Bp9143 TaxID=2184574 RepID=UPI000F5990FA|nr:helix-turn-helix domain-containing protein [Burkholderia sp. Bp9143]RQR32375.1 helix-turn-helix domain-containing protein [Burkholderia sp. Bp9143]